jgi:hypothetical protein
MAFVQFFFAPNTKLMKPFCDKNVLIKGQGDHVKICRKIMVEATEGCSINQGKYAKRVKSTKFENKFCRLVSQHLKSSKTCENFSKSVYDQGTQKIVKLR